MHSDGIRRADGGFENAHINMAGGAQEVGQAEFIAAVALVSEQQVFGTEYVHAVGVRSPTA